MLAGLKDYCQSGKLSRLCKYFSKPTGRAASHPHFIEIMVARTGHPAHTFRINLDHLKKAGVGLGAAMFLWFSGTFYVAYSHVANMDAIAHADQQAEKIARLKQSNNQLNAEKQHMGQSLFNLQQRVEHLATRVHGMVNSTDQQFPAERREGYQGGFAIPVSPGNAGEIMRAEFSTLNDRLSRLLPTLENKLEREASRPVGYPIAGVTELSSDYGLRGNPFGHGHEFHNGVDFSVDTGTPILATGPGVVGDAGYDGPNGIKINLDHGFGYRSVYGHLSKLNVKRGDKVVRGQLVGYSGSTGRSSGPHLHYTLYYRGRTIDPEHYLKSN